MCVLTYFLSLKNSTECKNILGPEEGQGITYLLLKRTEKYNSCKWQNPRNKKNNNTLKNKNMSIPAILSKMNVVNVLHQQCK